MDKTKQKINQIINKYVGRVPVEILQELRNELALSFDATGKKEINRLIMKTADFFNLTGREGLNEYFVRAKPKISVKYIKQIFKERGALSIIKGYDLKTQTVQIPKSQVQTFKKTMINVLPDNRVKLASILAYKGKVSFLGSLGKIREFSIATAKGRKLQQDITKRAMRTKGTLERRIADDLRLRFKIARTELKDKNQKLTWRKFYKAQFGSGRVKNLTSAVRVEISFIRGVLGKLDYLPQWHPYVVWIGEKLGTYKGYDYTGKFTWYADEWELPNIGEDWVRTGGVDYGKATPVTPENKKLISETLKERGLF